MYKIFYHSLDDLIRVGHNTPSIEALVESRALLPRWDNPDIYASLAADARNVGHSPAIYRIGRILYLIGTRRARSFVARTNACRIKLAHETAIIVCHGRPSLFDLHEPGWTLADALMSKAYRDSAASTQWADTPVPLSREESSVIYASLCGERMLDEAVVLSTMRKLASAYPSVTSMYTGYRPNWIAWRPNSQPVIYGVRQLETIARDYGMEYRDLCMRLAELGPDGFIKGGVLYPHLNTIFSSKLSNVAKATRVALLDEHGQYAPPHMLTELLP